MCLIKFLRASKAFLYRVLRLKSLLVVTNPTPFVLKIIPGVVYPMGFEGVSFVSSADIEYH